MIQKLDDNSYFKLPAVSNSLLGRFAKCPAAASIPIDTTPAMSMGTLCHTLILEGAIAFKERYYVMDKADGRTKEGKAAKERAINEADGRIVITTDDLYAAQAIATSVYNHPSANSLLQSGKPEMAITWKDKDTGIDCKAKADWMSHDVLIDLKTCQDSSYQVFSKTIVNMGYYRQLAMYRDGIRENLVPIDKCIIIAVSTNAPYACEVYEVEEDLLEVGQGKYKRLLREYKACCEASNFPAYSYAGIHSIRCPQWMKEADSE